MSLEGAGANVDSWFDHRKSAPDSESPAALAEALNTSNLLGLLCNRKTDSILGAAFGLSHWFALVCRQETPAAADHCDEAGSFSTMRRPALTEWWNCDSLLPAPVLLGKAEAEAASFLAAEWTRSGFEVLLVTRR